MAAHTAPLDVMSDVEVESAITWYLFHPFVPSPSFRSGNYGTKFIAEQYPDGFSGVPLSKEETLDLIAAAVSFYLKITQKGLWHCAALYWIVPPNDDIISSISIFVLLLSR
jgi:hypothetical protein